MCVQPVCLLALVRATTCLRACVRACERAADVCSCVRKLRCVRACCGVRAAARARAGARQMFVRGVHAASGHSCVSVCVRSCGVRLSFVLADAELRACSACLSQCPTARAGPGHPHCHAGCPASAAAADLPVTVRARDG